MLFTPFSSGSHLPLSLSANLQWQTQPLSQTVEEGNTTTFSCSAQYTKKIQEYDWEFNNQFLPGDSRFVKKDDGKMLEISNVKFEDRGNYRCVAKRKGKTLGTSQNAALNVKGKEVVPRFACMKFRAYVFPVELVPRYISRFLATCFLFLVGGH